METLQFEPIFLYKDDERIENSKKLHREWLFYIQNGLDEAKKLFDSELTDEELTSIMYSGWKAVETVIRSKSSFPNAKIETLLDLEGKNSHNAKLALIHVPVRSKAIKASVNKGKATFTDEVEKELIDKHSFYTRSIEQNQMLESAKKLVKMISELLDKKVICELELYKICSNLKIVRASESHRGQVEPNYKRILEV